ncbi:S9 family peptidase [Alicyclobacillus ferrooxydans]|uniref:Peptidase S9 n=1 Tax=Alicyclobacillus ferrooxydans TaxID=471514 RepID=A0A0P9CQ55_9BACL|nr:S9 family peptidase [Alicyclobacillus ferrooxydans]KPV44983.1 hypothetical protein AN477_04215 [Alicyclobacillus ferrooxydans]
MTHSDAIQATIPSPIPIERYMEVRSSSGPSFSHDGKTMYFLSTITGMNQVWALSEGRPWPVQLTFFSDRVMAVSACPTGDVLIINGDNGGSENAQLYLTDSTGVSVQDLTGDPAHIHNFGSWSPDGRSFSYTSNRRDGRAFDVYLYNMDTNTHRPVHQSDHTNRSGRFHPSGKSILVSRHYSNLNNDLFLVDIETGEMRLLTPHESEASFTRAQFSQDGAYLYVLSDLDSEFTRVARISLDNLSLTWITDDKWDAENLVLSSDGRYLAFSKNEDGTSKLYVLEVLEQDAAHDVPEWSAVAGLPALPAGVVAEVRFARDKSRLALTLSTPSAGIDIWTLNLSDKALSRTTFAAASGVPQTAFAAPELIHYPSFDGLSIPAYYYRPQHSDGPYSVVVYVHGGPESQSRNGFNPVVQYFVNQGYAVLVPNVRGSSGYGRTYVHLDDVRKRMDSVHDLASSVDWLVQEGNARKDAIAVMGGSYGGFMVLAAVTHYPDLWAAGVDIVGIANLRTFMENTSPYRRHLRECEYGTVEQDGAFFDEISPIHHVDKIQAPMIVIHGANDPRVPVGEAEQIVGALESRQHPVQYLRFEDEGHGVVKLTNRIRAYGQIARFLEQHLSTLKNQ